MNKQDQLKQQIAEAVSRFQEDQLAVVCESITVDFHPDNLVVTLSDGTCQAEREYARDREAGELLERFYNELFEVVKPILEGKIQDILGRQVRRSRLSIDPCSGAGVILLALAGETCLER